MLTGGPNIGPLTPRPNNRHRASNKQSYFKYDCGCAVMIIRPAYTVPYLFNHWLFPHAPGPVASAGAPTPIAQCIRRAHATFSPHL